MNLHDNKFFNSRIATIQTLTKDTGEITTTSGRIKDLIQSGEIDECLGNWIDYVGFNTFEYDCDEYHIKIW
jgi:hypothetical protein